MANLRDIKKRITSVQSTKQITRTMEMVATAKIKHATQRVEASTPYSQIMQKVLSSLSQAASNAAHPLLQNHEEKKRAIAIAVVSDRGLAGGFNISVLRKVEKFIKECNDENMTCDVIVCGKTGVSYFTFRNVEPLLSYRDLSADPTMDQAQEISTYVQKEYEEISCDKVCVFYNHARNAADQDLIVEEILPVPADFAQDEDVTETVEEVAGDTADATISNSPDFEPDEESVLGTLLPSYVQTKVYHALVDSAAAEQGARRKAMKSATDNATEMIENLERMYNRARQGAITTELNEIVGGAAALEEE